MKTTLIFAFLFSLLLIGCVGCGGKGVIAIDKGTISETKDAITGALIDAKAEAIDLVYISWSDQNVVISPNTYHIVHQDVKDVSGALKKVKCQIKSDNPISIYALSENDLDKAMKGQSFSSYAPCSTKNTQLFNCPDTCNVPFDTAFYISNDGSVNANVYVKLQYFRSNPSP
jgi:hypothetical protein